jgi:hypothetical protein
MFLQVRKIIDIIQLLKTINISYNSKTDCFHIKSDSNIVIQSDKNIILLSKGDLFQFGNSIHLNSPLEIIPETEKHIIKEISNGN